MTAGVSKWIKTQDASLARFAWQRGYGAFSLGVSELMPIVEYIESQEEHHRTRSFQDELRALLKRHIMEYDERYVWD